MSYRRVTSRHRARIMAACLIAAGASLAVSGGSEDPQALLAWPSLGTPPPSADGAMAWEHAGEHLGERVTIRGKVVRTHKGDQAVHLNFRQEWKGTFQVVIFARSWCDFPEPPEKLFRGREILVSGVVKEYRGAPEIVVDSPDQLRIADDSGQFVELPSASGSTQPPPPRAPGVRVASWNLENFFDGWDDPYREDERTVPPSVSAPRRQRIADALRQLDADVVCLQEVENRFVLDEFVHAYLPDAGYEVVLVEGNDTRGIDVALLSRLPIESVTSYRHLRFADDTGKQRSFSRDLLRVRIGGALQADVFCVHLKSQSGGAEADRLRAAEARAAAGILRTELGRDPSWRALIAGDFNDVIDTPALDAFLDTRTAGGAGLIDLCAGTDSPTYHEPPHVSRIDFLLATPALATKKKEAEVVEKLPGVELNCASDHYPVAARFAPR